MPTYDYECASCGHNFEAFQAMSDKPLVSCPECKKRSLKRLIGGGMGIIFKGSGFYVTDSRSSGKKASKSGSDAGSDSSPKTESTKTETSTAESGKADGKKAEGKKADSSSSQKAAS